MSTSFDNSNSKINTADQQFARKEGDLSTSKDLSKTNDYGTSSLSKEGQLKGQDSDKTWDKTQGQQFDKTQPTFDKTQDSSLRNQERQGSQLQQQGQGFQQQLAGAQPLQGQGIAGGSFNRETGVGLVNLKPICIEQEPVMYRPQPLTIPQPPLMVQPEAITIPQPPIVIHPEPIVIPQPPLVFQPPAVAVPRPAVTIQPEPVVLNRPSYSVQPTIQFDLQGCNKFNQPDFKQHVHIKLSDQQQNELQQQQGLQGQQMQGQQWQQGQQGQLSGQQQQLSQGRLSDRVTDGQKDLSGQSGMGLQESQFTPTHQRVGSGQFVQPSTSTTGTTKESSMGKSRNDYVA